MQIDAGSLGDLGSGKESTGGRVIRQERRGGGGGKLPEKTFKRDMG